MDDAYFSYFFCKMLKRVLLSFCCVISLRWLTFPGRKPLHSPGVRVAKFLSNVGSQRRTPSEMKISYRNRILKFVVRLTLKGSTPQKWMAVRMTIERTAIFASILHRDPVSQKNILFSARTCSVTWF